MTNEITTTTTKFTVTNAQRRQLTIAISDACATIDQYDDDNMFEYYEKIGRLTAMIQGAIPVELPKVSVTPISEKRDTITYTAFFFASADDMRQAKTILQRALQLNYQPHAMAVADEPGMRRFSVPFVTREAATKIAETYEIFTKFALKDTQRAEAKAEI